MNRYIDADKGLRSKIQLETGCNYATADRIVESRPTAEVISLDRVKQAREEINECIRTSIIMGGHQRANGLSEARAILDKLIAESEG